MRQIEAKLKDFPGWWYEDGWIRRNYKTDGWPTHADARERDRLRRRSGIPITRPLGDLGRVIVKLQNHAAGGITDKDFELARRSKRRSCGAQRGALEGTPNKFVRSGDPR